ncbi:MAG: hypothetical protein PWQ97_394 [Tepidanaerobacteraceae bacterium]|nr:hypothetical protein [Tepidanaerobacteraceae bacterium]
MDFKREPGENPGRSGHCEWGDAFQKPLDILREGEKQRGTTSQETCLIGISQPSEKRPTVSAKSEQVESGFT